MREPNLGITTQCCMCGRSFWTEDGLPICSSACENEFEKQQEELEREAERQEKVDFCEVINQEYGVYSEDTDFDEMDDEELEKAYDFLYELEYLK